MGKQAVIYRRTNGTSSHSALDVQLPQFVISPEARARLGAIKKEHFPLKGKAGRTNAAMRSLQKAVRAMPRLSNDIIDRVANDPDLGIF